MTPPPPPPPARRDTASPEWQLESASTLWPAREYAIDGESAAARAAAERLSSETGMPSSPELVHLLEAGVRAVLWALYEQIPVSGPLPGQRSGRSRLAQLRAREVATPSGRRTSGVVEVLLDWGVTSDPQRAAWISSLVVGRDSWDEGHFGSSAVWATGGGHFADDAGNSGAAVSTGLPVSARAAIGWAVAADRLLTGDDSRRRREQVTRSVAGYRLDVGLAHDDVPLGAVHGALEGGESPCGPGSVTGPSGRETTLR